MKSSTAKFAAGLVMELHPSRVLVKAGTFPLQTVARGRRRAHESGQEIDCAVQRVEDWP